MYYLSTLLEPLIPHVLCKVLMTSILNFQRVYLSCFPSTIKHRNFYFRVFTSTSSLGLKCLSLLQRGSLIGFYSYFPLTVIKNSIKTETVLLRHLNPPSNDYESVYLQLLRFSLYLSRSSLRLSYTILVYLSYFPSTYWSG